MKDWMDLDGDGKSIRSASQLKSGDIIETRFAEGSVKAKVE